MNKKILMLVEKVKYKQYNINLRQIQNMLLLVLLRFNMVTEISKSLILLITMTKTNKKITQYLKANKKKSVRVN